MVCAFASVRVGGCGFLWFVCLEWLLLGWRWLFCCVDWLIVLAMGVLLAMGIYCDLLASGLLLLFGVLCCVWI